MSAYTCETVFFMKFSDPIIFVVKDRETGDRIQKIFFDCIKSDTRVFQISGGDEKNTVTTFITENISHSIVRDL